MHLFFVDLVVKLSQYELYVTTELGLGRDLPMFVSPIKVVSSLPASIMREWSLRAGSCAY